MAKHRRPRPSPGSQPRVVGYLVDGMPGYHSYVFVEGVGECRAQFRQLVEDLDRGVADIVMVYKASLLFIDTSPMWMEKFIATVKRRGVRISDAKASKIYDLRNPEEEAAFRAVNPKAS